MVWLTSTRFLARAMSFAMSLPRTKRVKYITPDGTEVFQEEDRWALVRAVHTQQVRARAFTSFAAHRLLFLWCKTREAALSQDYDFTAFCQF